MGLDRAKFGGRSMARRRLTADERALWREVMADVRPLTGDPPAVAPPTQLPPPAASLGQPAPPRPAVMAGPLRPPAELVAGRAAGVDRRRMERLTGGKLKIDAVVDLHGMTQAAAHHRIERVIADSIAGGRRCLLVVTGKGGQGGGILRRRLADWLNLPASRPHVLAFAEARPEHGGGGAFYVLLRRRR
jgi:DNA-nicking Smr family endonuclease